MATGTILLVAVLRDARKSALLRTRLMAHYWPMAPENFATCAHFSMSWRKKASSSAGVIVIGIAPWRSHAATISGRVMVLLMAALSLSTIGFGVPAGAIRPSQIVASNPGTPASAMVGTSGSTLDRVVAVVPSARTWPAWTLDAMVVMASNIISICPPMTALRLSPAALCGTWTMSVPVIFLNSSAAM